MVHHYDLHDEHTGNIHIGITAREVVEIAEMGLDLVCKYARTGYLYKGRYRVARHGEKVVEDFKSNNNNNETGYVFPTEYRIDFAKRWDNLPIIKFFRSRQEVINETSTFQH